MARSIREHEELLGGDAMLGAVAFSAERLLLAGDWRHAVDDVLRHLGSAADVSRAYLIRVDPTETHEYLATQLAEWCAAGVASQFENPTLRGSSLSDTGFARWVELMTSHQTVHGAVQSFPDPERRELGRQEILSIAAFPVFVEGSWWAFIGFDDCVRERAWSRRELDSLRAVAGMLGAAVERQRSESRRLEAEARYEQLVAQNPAVTYTESHHAEGGRITFVSPQIEDLLGYPPERPLEDRGWWWATVHPEDVERVQRANGHAFAASADFDQVYRMRAVDGRWVWVRDKARPVHDDDGQISYWQGFIVDVTEQMEAGERLRQAEARYRAMVELIPAVTYTDFVGDDGQTFMGFVSPQIEDILGVQPQRFLDDGGFWFELMHPDDLARLRAIDAFNNADFAPFDHEYRMRHADGHWVWVHDTSTAVMDDDGSLAYFLGFLTDVTGRREAEDRLRNAEQTFRSMVEHSPALLYIQEKAAGDPGRSLTTYIGPGSRELCGYTAEEVREDPEIWRRFIHPEDRERVLSEDARTNLDGSESWSMEYRLVHRDGRVVWILDEARLNRPDGGAPYWQGFMLDITARKEAERRLHDAHEHLRLLVDSAMDAVVTMDVDGVITGWNPQAEMTFGWTSEEAIGRSLAETIVPHAYRAAHLEGLRRWRETGEGAVLNNRIEISALDREGRSIPVEISIVPVQVGSHTVFSGFIRDISERKRVQEELERALEVEREATKRLRALDEMKDTFLQAVSHDLRTPLAAILGLAITLERGDVGLDTEDTRHLAGRIEHNARRLERLVTNLLDLDRLARGVLAPSFEPTDVGELVRRMVLESDPSLRDQVEISIESVVVPVDAPKVERIVENLLVNAVKHTPRGTMVHVSVTDSEEGATIAVEDEGAGVPDELREKIFEEFRQGTDTPQASPGVGVGLTLVRRFAEMHHGRAWVAGRDGGGASFRVFLPRQHPVEPVS
jgi:PAS domain S-box-containing protein